MLSVYDQENLRLTKQKDRQYSDERNMQQKKLSVLFNENDWNPEKTILCDVQGCPSSLDTLSNSQPTSVMHVYVNGYVLYLVNRCMHR